MIDDFDNVGDFFAKAGEALRAIEAVEDALAKWPQESRHGAVDAALGYASSAHTLVIASGRTIRAMLYAASGTDPGDMEHEHSGRVRRLFEKHLAQIDLA